MTSPKITEHSVTFRVRYAETDQMGYVHHANFLVYFEMGRTELLRANGWDYKSIEARGFYLVVAKIAVKFRSPARYDDMLTLVTKVERVTSVRIEHSYKLMRGDELLAEGESTLACVDRDGRLSSMPDEIMGRA